MAALRHFLQFKDLSREEIDHVFARAAWIKRKEFAPEACRGCDSFVACQGACPLYWKAVGTAEIEGRARVAVRGASPWN